MIPTHESPLAAPFVPQALPGDVNDVWDWWRNQMPVTKHWAYFDHAAVGPLSGPAATVVRNFAIEAAEHGDTPWLSWSQRVHSLRDTTAKLLNCDRDEVALIPNTTTGINVIAEGFPWNEGDNLVSPEGEFPSNLFPWQNQAHRGVSMRLVPRRDGRVEVNDLMAQVDDRTRIIALSWVGYASGFRIDLPRLVAAAHAEGVLVMLDAIQGLGMYPLDWQTCPVDFLAADGHKWLLSPEGAGVAVIRREHIPTLRATDVGWASVKNSHDYQHPKLELKDEAARFESGSANMVGLMALAASMELFVAVRQRFGPDCISKRVCDLAAYAHNALKRAGATALFGPFETDHASGIVTFEVAGMSPATFRKRALDHGIVVSCRGGGVRASIHAYNNETDIDQLAQLVVDCK
ncbi:MAG: aminotransferase class V-fold PLP-dependent enzyme [Planctomycetota bacterium]